MNNVIYLEGEFKNLNSKNLFYLKKLAEKSQNKRSRFCFHKNLNSEIHQMLICLHKDTIIQRHLHKHSKETLIHLEGNAQVNIFDKNKMIREKINFNKRNFYLEIPKNTIHSIAIKSKFLVFVETIKGPFKEENTIFI